MAHLLTDLVRVYLYKRCIDGLCSSGVAGAPRYTKVLCLHLHMCGTACADGEVDRPAPPRPPQEQVRVADGGGYSCEIQMFYILLSLPRRKLVTVGIAPPHPYRLKRLVPRLGNFYVRCGISHCLLKPSGPPCTAPAPASTLSQAEAPRAAAGPFLCAAAVALAVCSCLSRCTRP